MDLSKIKYIRVNDKNLLNYPGAYTFKECYFLTEPDFSYETGQIVDGITLDNDFVYYDEYKNIIRELRKYKLSKLNSI